MMMIYRKEVLSRSSSTKRNTNVSLLEQGYNDLQKYSMRRSLRVQLRPLAVVYELCYTATVCQHLFPQHGLGGEGERGESVNSRSKFWEW